jgi:hypothetical protein
MARWLWAVALTAGVSAASVNAADEKPARDKPPEEKAAVDAPLNEREQAFSDLLNNSALVGTFTVEHGNDEADRPRHKERYVIKGVKKVSDGNWVVNSQIVYGKLDVTVPVPVQVDWAGDTPVLSVTDLSIPLVGSEFTARVMFYDGRYAGTWRHGKVGGLMFGRVETSPPEGSEPPAAKSPESVPKSADPPPAK